MSCTNVAWCDFLVIMLMPSESDAAGGETHELPQFALSSQFHFVANAKGDFSPPDTHCDKVKHNAAQFTLDSTLLLPRLAANRQTDTHTNKQTLFSSLFSVHRSLILSMLLRMLQKKCCCCCCCTSHTSPRTAAWSVAHLQNNNHAV